MKGCTAEENSTNNDFGGYVMKKFLTVAAMVLATAVTVSSVPAVSAAEVNYVPMGVYSVVTDDDGTEQMVGAPDENEVENAQEYELYVDRKEVLSVGASGDSSKRYHVDFMLPDTTNEVYLTGLSADKVEEIQQKIIDSYVEGEPFDFNDLEFIDAEKLVPGNSDSNLCWAASCSNMLAYTGWAQRAGFADEDEVFDLYNASFSNSAGFQRNGLAWFFNGVALGNNLGFNGPRIYNYPNSGGYFSQYAYDMVCNWEFIRSVKQLNNMEERLRNGYGISPGIGIYRNGELRGSHAITLWGFVTDTSLDKNNINRFRNVFISDSDSDMVEKTDRTLADNKIHMKPAYDDGKGRLCFDYDEYEEPLKAVFEDYNYLMPYKSDIPREQNMSTSRNKVKNPDLTFGQMTLSENKYDVEQVTLYESGKKVYFSYEVENASDKTYFSNVNVSLNVVNEKGENFLNDSVRVSRGWMSMASTTEINYGELSKLPAGDYKITYKVNENHPVKEAYYYNNTYTQDFKVRDSYLSGDCNKDKQISIGDATEIQRLIAGMYEDDKAVERGNVNGGELDVIDATLLQKFLAKMDVDASIGTKQLHTVI